MLAALILALAPAGGAATPGNAGEWLALPPAPNFIVAYRAEQGGARVVERVARGESIDSWSRMITEQSFAGIAKEGAEGFLSRLGGMWAASCPGAETTPTITRQGDTGIVASFRADCPLNPQTGKPETMFAAATTSGNAVYLAQVAFRRRPNAADVAWADEILSAMTICQTGSAKAICQDQ